MEPTESALLRFKPAVTFPSISSFQSTFVYISGATEKKGLVSLSVDMCCVSRRCGGQWPHAGPGSCPCGDAGLFSLAHLTFVITHQDTPHGASEEGRRHSDVCRSVTLLNALTGAGLGANGLFGF